MNRCKWQVYLCNNVKTVKTFHKIMHVFLRRVIGNNSFKKNHKLYFDVAWFVVVCMFCLTYFVIYANIVIQVRPVSVVFFCFVVYYCFHCKNRFRFPDCLGYIRDWSIPSRNWNLGIPIPVGMTGTRIFRNTSSSR